MVLTSIDKKDKPKAREQIEFCNQGRLVIERWASLGEILGGVAHEINNPLQIILGKSQILMLRMAKEGSSPKSLEDLKSIEKGAQRIAELINSLSDLTHSKAENKKLKTDVDVNYLLGSIFPLIRASFKTKKIELILNAPENLPKIKGNPSRLKELLLYLTLNAKQRIGEGGKLEVNLKKEDGYLKVELIDLGEKLPEGIGAGLGEPLTLHLENELAFGILNSYMILQEHKGSMEIKSSSSKGNSLTIWLPVI